MARARGEGVGVLIHGTMTPDVNVDDARLEPGAVPLPELDAPELAGLVARAEQGVAVASAAELARVVGESLGVIARAAARSLERPLEIEAGGHRLRYAHPAFPLAKLLTVDVLRAREAFVASRAMIARHDFSRATVFFPHA